jgi:hypothetical protein
MSVGEPHKDGEKSLLLDVGFVGGSGMCADFQYEHGDKSAGVELVRSAFVPARRIRNSDQRRYRGNRKQMAGELAEVVGLGARMDKFSGMGQGGGNVGDLFSK